MKFLMLVTVCLFMILFSECIANDKICKENVCILPDYQKSRLPIINGTTDIRVSLVNPQIMKVNDYDCTITLKLGIDVMWQEPRLIILPNSVNNSTHLDKTFLNNLWTPNIFIANLKDIKGRIMFKVNYRTMSKMCFYFTQL